MFLVKELGLEKEWCPVLSIEGITYEPGYEYFILAERKASGDFKLEKIISTEHKVSADLPLIVYDESWPDNYRCSDIR